MVRRDDGIVKVLDFGLVKLTEKHTQQKRGGPPRPPERS